MSAYPWMKRHKRYLSFRYIFPELAAGWIAFKRFLLRVLWFFTHPIDEFLDDIRDAMLWPFAALNTLWRWMVIGTHEFFSDLLRGIEMAFGWMGGLPVWTGAAVSGVMGIILTILLFLLPAINPGVTASITALAQPQAEAANVAPAFDPFQQSPAQPEYDPFEDRAPARHELPLSNFNRPLPELQMHLAQLAMPTGWNSRQQISVVSAASRVDLRDLKQRFDRTAVHDRWGQPRFDREQRALHFTPYASRVGVRSTSVAPSWVNPESVVEPLNQFSTQRHPHVVIEKSSPKNAPVGQPLQYGLTVRNVGEETLDNVRVREQLSNIQRVSNTRPPAKVVGEALVWDLAELRPGESRQLQIEMQPNSEVLLAHKSAVQVTTRVAAVSNVRVPRPEPQPVEPKSETPASVMPQFFDAPEPEPLPQPEAEAEPIDQEPIPQIIPFEDEDEPEVLPQFEPEPVRIEEPVQPLSLEMFAPQAVASGGEVRTVFEVQNRGGAEMTDLILAVELTDELDHPNGHLLELKIPRIAAGDVFRTRLTTEAVKDGTATLSSRLTNSVVDSLTAQQEVRISKDVAAPSDVVFEMLPQCHPVPCGRPMF